MWLRKLFRQKLISDRKIQRFDKPYRMSFIYFMSMGQRAIVNLRLLGIMGLVVLLEISCSEVPIKMQCSEIEARIDYGNLTGDQLRFAMDELNECRGKQKAAAEKDSNFIDGAEKKFTPPE